MSLKNDVYTKAKQEANYICPDFGLGQCLQDISRVVLIFYEDFAQDFIILIIR